MHEAHTMWDLGRVDIRSLTSASRETVFKFEPVTIKSQGSKQSLIKGMSQFHKKLNVKVSEFFSFKTMGSSH